MKTLKKAIVIAAATSAVALGVAAPASADPGDDSCPLALSFMCHFVPAAPGLDHDIDLTKGGATLNGDALPQTPGGTLDTESGPPTPPCLGGCT